MATRPKTITIQQDHYDLLNKYAQKYVDLFGNVATFLAGPPGADTSTTRTPKIGALPVATTTRLSAQDIETQINHLVADLDRQVRNYKSGDRHLDYTPDGQKKRWADLTVKQRARRDQLAELPGKYVDAAHQQAQNIRRTLMPTTDDPQAQMVAEMTYNRIMSRPAVVSADDKFAAARNEIMKLGPSVSRTLALNEMVARSELNDASIDSLLMEESSEYREACWGAQMAQQHAVTLTRKLNQVTGALDQRPANELQVQGFTLTGMAEISVASPLQGNQSPLHDVAYDVGPVAPLADGPTVKDLNPRRTYTAADLDHMSAQDIQSAGKSGQLDLSA